MGRRGEVKARRKDMDESVKEEVKNMSSAKRGQPAAGSKASKPTFVGTVNTQRAFFITCREQHHLF